MEDEGSLTQPPSPRREDELCTQPPTTRVQSALGTSLAFLLVVMNVKGGGRKDKITKKYLSARSKEENPGITQPQAGVFRESMASFLSYIQGRFESMLPAAWLLTEVAWSLKGNNMSALSRHARDGASSRRETQGKPEAAVICGEGYAEGAEALTLELLSNKRGTGKHYVQIAGKSLRVDTLDDFDVKQYEEMLSRVAAARLTLAPNRQCLLLTYHGLHIITGPGSDKEKFRRKCRYLRWLLLLARGLAEVLGSPVVVGGDLNLDVSKLEVKEVLGDATEGAELVEYKVNLRRKKNVVDWLYLINPRNGHTRLEWDKCVAVDPAQPYRERLAEGITLHPNWFDHDALLALLRLVVCRQTA